MKVVYIIFIDCFVVCHPFHVSHFCSAKTRWPTAHPPGGATFDHAHGQGLARSSPLARDLQRQCLGVSSHRVLEHAKRTDCLMRLEIQKEKPTWRSGCEEYNVVHNNSLDFADALCEALRVGKLPRQEGMSSKKPGLQDVRGLAVTGSATSVWIGFLVSYKW